MCIAAVCSAIILQPHNNAQTRHTFIERLFLQVQIHSRRTTGRTVEALVLKLTRGKCGDWSSNFASLQFDFSTKW